MSKKKKFLGTLVCVGMALALLVGGFAIYGLASSDDVSAKETAVSTHWKTDGQTLTEPNGMTDEEKADMEARLEQDLADGKITQEQYDAILNGEMPKFGGIPFKPKPGGIPGGKFELTDELKAEMEERLLQDLADGKITQEQYDAILSGEMPVFGGMPFMPNPDCQMPERPEFNEGQKPEMPEGGFEFPGGNKPQDGKMGNKPGMPPMFKR